MRNNKEVSNKYTFMNFEQFYEAVIEEFEKECLKGAALWAKRCGMVRKFVYLKDDILKNQKENQKKN